MGSYYLDSSALAKRYIREFGTGWVVDLLDPLAGNEIHVLAIAQAEVVSALVRISRTGAISHVSLTKLLQQIESDFSSVLHSLAVTHPLIADAIRVIQTSGLRAYDAMQLAGAMQVRRFLAGQALPPIVFVSADRELNAAALAEGFVVEDPANHP